MCQAVNGLGIFHVAILLEVQILAHSGLADDIKGVAFDDIYDVHCLCWADQTRQYFINKHPGFPVNNWNKVLKCTINFFELYPKALVLLARSENGMLE